MDGLEAAASVTGPIRKRGEGSWQVRVSTGARDPASGRYLYAERHVRGTKGDAQRALDALSVEVARRSHRHQAKRRMVSDLLDAFYAKLLESGSKPLNVRKSHAIVSAAYDQTVRWGWVERNPVLRATPPPSRGREIRAPTITEPGLLLQECEEAHPGLAALLHVATCRLPAPAAGSSGGCNGATSTSIGASLPARQGAPDTAVRSPGSARRL